MALLSVWPENQVFAALFDKLAYGAISAALNARVLPRFDVPGRGRVAAAAPEALRDESLRQRRAWARRLRR